ncbi:PRC-barrel domain-containing protein [Candidatus Woesearchaeota archaeon]|nr:PRC-barrel domain-containing protein [Candidatus Woesearchaeota archaeon]
MLKIRKVSEVYGMRVFTDSGDYFGDIEEAVLTNTKVGGWRIRATKNSYLVKILGSAKGVIVPHNLVSSVGDVMIISKNAVPAYKDEETAA